MNPIANLLLVTLLMGVSACSLTPSPESITTYRLTVELPLNPKQSIQPLNLSLRVNKPNASGYLATTRIVVMTENNQLSVYKGAQWHETTPLMVRNHLLDTFRQTQLISFISGDDKQLAAQVELDSDLRAFQTEYRKEKHLISLTLAARLVNPKEKKIIASQVFNEQISAKSEQLSDVMDAFVVAQNQLSQSVVRWTYQTLNTNH
jgi:cholesterol transport system auxiliary component